MSLRICWKLVILAVLVIACVGCDSRGVETIQGELFSQSVDEGFFYDTWEYTLITSRAYSENSTNGIGTAQYYTFKLRSGHELQLGGYYIFKVEHIENGEFILKELELKEQF